MLLLSRKDIKSVFSMTDSIEAVKEAFVLFSEGKVKVPLRGAIKAENGGVFVAMPAFSEELGYHCVKQVNHFPQNIDKGLPTLPAQILLSKAEDGVIVSLLDGLYVTQLRTGASSGAAFSVLAKETCHKGALIGTGAQAATQLEAMVCARQLDEVYIYDLNAERLNAFVANANQEFASYGAKFVAARSSDEAVDGADLLITMTPSKKPVFDGRRLMPGATVSCVGSFMPDMQELSPYALTRASKLFFDSQEAVLSESGDVLIPLHEGLITECLFAGDLGDVIQGKKVGRENDDEIIVYKTVGIGAQDLVASKAIYERALAAGVGMEW